MAFEHAGVLTLMADIMARTLLFPLTISDWYTTEILGFLFEFITFDSDKRLIKLIDLGNRFIKLSDS